MKNESKKHINKLEPMPPWAAGRANGKYMQEKAQLTTRDGRKIGNACVLNIYFSNKKQKAEIITDAGNVFIMSENEMKELFHPPVWVQKDITPAQEKILNLLNLIN